MPHLLHLSDKAVGPEATDLATDNQLNAMDLSELAFIIESIDMPIPYPQRDSDSKPLGYFILKPQYSVYKFIASKMKQTF
jgi:hypothetical protein